jgi:hypothetical protein
MRSTFAQAYVVAQVEHAVVAGQGGQRAEHVGASPPVRRVDLDLVPNRPVVMPRDVDLAGGVAEEDLAPHAPREVALRSPRRRQVPPIRR